MPRANPDVNYEISIHALLAESDPFTTSMSTRLVGFLSTLSLRRATYAPLTSELHCLFLSTLSLRRATHPGQPVRGMPSHFYPRSPCGERRSVASVAFASVLISIHTLLAESDAEVSTMQGLNVISIHALLAESDSWYLVGVCLLFVFLSTLSLRRATWGGSRGGKTAALFLSTLSLRRATSFTGVSWSQPSNFYPRSPCGERLHIGRGCVMIHRISIHALLAESDPPAAASIPFCATFLSTLSLRRATAKSSIAAVPRALFLSTLSLRRATFRTPRRSKWDTHFYPRSPCGERRLLQNGFLDVAAISIHALLAESDI